MQTSEQLAAFRALCQANLLGKADVWQHKQSGNWIIGRAGIEKIQGLNNIQVGIELAAAGVDFAVVKASAQRTVERKKLKVESGLGQRQEQPGQLLRRDGREAGQEPLHPDADGLLRAGRIRGRGGR